MRDLGRLGRVTLWGLLLGAVGYASWKAFFDPSDTADFKSIWFAGLLWSEGINPYSEVFRNRAQEEFLGLNRPHAWFYPPNWWPFATPLAALEYDLVKQVWRSCNGILLILVCVHLWSRLRVLAPAVPEVLLIAMTVFALTTSASSITLSLGQTSIVMLAGVALFVTSFASGNRALMVAALVVLALKPTVALTIAGLLLVLPAWWPALLIAAGIVLICAMPPFVMHGPGTVLSLMLERIGEYSQYSVNAPQSMTGLRNLLYHALGVDASPILLTLLGVGLVAGAGWLARRCDSPAERLVVACTAVVLTVVMVPLHTYDMVVLTPLVAVIGVLPPRMAVAAGGLLFLAWRPNNLSSILGLSGLDGTYFAGSFLASLVSLVLAMLFCAALARSRAVRVTSQVYPPRQD